VKRTECKQNSVFKYSNWSASKDGFESYITAYKGGSKPIVCQNKAPHVIATKVRSHDLRITSIKGVSTIMTHCRIASCSKS